MSHLTEKLRQVLGVEAVRLNEPMSRHTTFRVGGPADVFVEPGTAEELICVRRICAEENVPFYILGNGSNLLVSDEGFRGVVAAIGKAWSSVAVEGVHIRAGAGAMLSAVAKRAAGASLTGLEFAAGIPGTVGGAVVMNAGAYGGEMSQVLATVTVLTPEGEVRRLPAGELELGYRTSCILQRGYVVLEAEFTLESGDENAIRATIEEFAARRREKQPLEYPSAGSTFKRPEGYFAGKLIEDAGLSGFTVGGAQVSGKHCGFIINRGDATAADIMELCRNVQRRVREMSGVELELEVKTLGNF